MMPNDSFIISQIHAGEESAFRYIFEKEYAAMCRFAFMIIHDHTTAESIADDIILNIWQNRENFNITTSLHAYLISSVRNRCINELKARLRKMSEAIPECDLKAETEMLLTVFRDDSHPLGILIEKELEDKIQECILSLPVECRTVFTKSRIEGMTYTEISKELGISVNTVKYHIKNALSILRRQLDGYLRFIILATLFF